MSSDSTVIPKSISRPRVLARGVGVTILHHPSSARVGDYAILLDVGSHDSASLSRTAPVFRSAMGRQTQGLETRQVSRSELTLEGVIAGGVRLHIPRELPLKIDGKPARDMVSISAPELEAGLLLELSETVLVLLHVIDVREPTSSRAQPEHQLMLGHSNALRAFQDELAKVADQSVPVLLRGPTGVGKELAAAAIHEQSGRTGRYVCVNMAAIAPSIAASELFGHKEGSFSGATKAHKGFFEQADGGTLFLDEVGDTPEAIQPLLLRAVELGVIQPVGGTPRQVDVRLIAATDADLEHSMESGGFKTALFHRLDGYPLRVPALVERVDDIPRLFLYFLRQELESTGELARLGPPDDTEKPWLPLSLSFGLCRYEWPGNVRQLRNVARQLAIANRGEPRFVLPQKLAEQLGMAATASRPAPARATEPSLRPRELTDDDVKQALLANDFHVGRTAAHLNVSRGWLNTRMHQCQGVRMAGELEADEIHQALSKCSDDVRRAARHLEVSERGLLLQMKRLGLKL